MKDLDWLNKESLYCSQGDNSGKRNPKKLFASANGCYLYDYDNICYFDTQMHNSACGFGYQNEIFKNALDEQYYSLPNLASEFLNTRRIELAELICSYMLRNYGVKGRVHFSIGGAQAVDDALKLAFNYTKRRSVFTFEGGYHGRTMASSSLSSSYRYTYQFGKVIDTIKLPFPNCTFCPYGKRENTCCLECVAQVKRLFDSEYFGVYNKDKNITPYAAFLFEPILGKGGYVQPPKEYLKEVISIFRDYGIIAISDEVQMGCYRTGKMWAFENFDIIPDMFIFGKNISNGIWPLSGVWAREEILEPKIFPPGSCHSTFEAHPIGCAMGVTAIKLLESESIKKEIFNSASKFGNIINKIKADYKNIIRCDILGHAAGMEFVDINGNPDKKFVSSLVNRALTNPIHIDGKKYGLILTQGGIYDSSIMLSPSLLSREKDLNLFDKLFRHYLDAQLTVM